MWLLRRDLAARIESARASGFQPSAEQIRAFDAYCKPEAVDRPRNMRVAGNVAEIRVEGVLTKKFDILAFLFGGGNTVYSDIQAAIANAENDPSIKESFAFVDSPGGEVDGLFDTLAAMEGAKKLRVVRAANATSAAYAIAAVPGVPIEATNPASTFGSIGVAASFFADEAFIDITSTEAPKKRPDVTTEEGKAVVREYLDALHDIFVEAIARGRKTTKAKVNAEFGQGGLIIAADAKRLGMIDKMPVKPRGPRTMAANVLDLGAQGDAESDDAAPIQSAIDQAAAGDLLASNPLFKVHGDGRVEMNRENVDAIERVTAMFANMPSNGLSLAAGDENEDVTAEPSAEQPQPTATGGKRSMKMDEKKLKEDHPELYAAVVSKAKAEGNEEGITAGKAQERKRVNAHLKLGKSCGDMSIALKAIESGASSLDEEVAADYQSAHMRRQDITARQTETDSAGKTVDGAKPDGDSQKSLADRTAEACGW